MSALNITVLKRRAGFVLALAVLWLAAGLARAEEPLKYVSVPHKSKVEVFGTSTLHDWCATGDTIKGALVFWEYHRTAVLAADNAFPLEGGEPVALDFWIPVYSLKSNSDGLNEKIWKELDCGGYPVIKFAYNSAELISNKPQSEVIFKVHGALYVNGVRKPLQLMVTLKDPRAKELTLETETNLKISDFKITPPTFMGGLLKSGDEVRVKVKWVVGPYKNLPRPAADDLAK